jgi:hypothetical protein
VTDARTVFAVVVGLIVLALVDFGSILTITVMRGPAAVPDGLITIKATLVGALGSLLVSTRSGPPPPSPPYTPGGPNA